MRNVVEISSAYWDTVKDPSFASEKVIGEKHTCSCGIKEVGETTFSDTTEDDDPCYEHSDSASVAKTALGAEEVTDYTNRHGLYYIDVTTMENTNIVVWPT